MLARPSRKPSFMVVVSLILRLPCASRSPAATTVKASGLLVFQA